MRGRGFFRFANDLKLRWKLLLVVLPLATVPALLVGAVVGYIATKQANRGITQTSKDVAMLGFSDSDMVMAAAPVAAKAARKPSFRRDSTVKSLPSF